MSSSAFADSATPAEPRLELWPFATNEALLVDAVVDGPAPWPPRLVLVLAPWMLERPDVRMILAGIVTPPLL